MPDLNSAQLNPAALRLVSHTTSDGVTTRELELGEVTAVLWALEHADPGTPLVLLGHGGGQDRHHPAMSGRARLLTDIGFRAVALDAGGHGPRPRTPGDEEEVGALRAARQAGEPIAAIVERYNADLASRTVPEWRALLSGLLAVPEIGDAPVGYWGVALGTAVGVRLVAEEPLIRAAVLGLFWPSTLLDAARRCSTLLDGSPSPSSSTCSGTTSTSPARTASPCSMRSRRPRSRCTSTMASTWSCHASKRRRRSGSSNGTCEADARFSNGEDRLS